MKELKFRTLRADEIEVRVGTINEKGLTLLLYKNARVDMDLLDETVGPYNWKREHSRDNANCTVSIWDDDKKEWISKEDVGTASNTEAEKGLASDSFKRSCVNFGIGRELYSAPFCWIPKDKYTPVQKNGKWTTYDRFQVANISYDENRRINGLKIINTSSKAEDKTVFTFLTKSLAKQLTKEAEARKNKVKEAIKNAKKES